VNVVDLTAEHEGRGKSKLRDFMGDQEKMVTSPDVINIEDDDEQPPAKRTKTGGHGFHSTKEEMVPSEADIADEVMPGSPLPSLPKTKGAGRKAMAQRRRHVDPSSRKAHGVAAPAVATRVPQPKKVLDFSPWLGNHPEDVLTEAVIKNGYFDGVKNTNQSESNSAKASIWPNLSQKNHQSLSMLGVLFTAVMEKRQAIGRCTAPSTFKPPPRVTVTDTKREAWLRDLANPDVPLRKQSRTIPHGIRGKLLMDQCMSKAIPLQRSVWLAKCVGANELRAFRRKGVSGSNAAAGEVKWVREWTVQVEQFLESVIGMCGQKDWQQKMNYAMKLVTAFFVERLLDSDHYLDWIVASMAEATLERLPMWILIIQLYWKSITAYSKRGKALVEGILEHLHNVTKSGPDANVMLKSRLQKLVAVMAVSNRGCLIIPRVWSKYKALLSSSSGADGSTKSLASDIARRNERLASPFSASSSEGSSPSLGLYLALDRVDVLTNLDQLMSKCMELLPNTSSLVVALLKWSSTSYRTGTARIYIASSLIARLSVSGHDTDAAILRYLNDARNLSVTTTENIYRVIVDLVRQECFSIGRYFQWLISSGALSFGDGQSLATDLLNALPPSGLPLHLQNTRKLMLARLARNADENAAIEAVIGEFEDAVLKMETGGVIPALSLDQLSMSGRFSVAQAIATKLSARGKEGSVALGPFLLARQVIECIGDLASLAELIFGVSASDNAALLATAVDTINLHAETFAAQSNLQPLLDALVEQYMTLRSQQPLDRSFILGLTAMAQRVPDKTILLKLLGDDLIICEQQSSLAVCSPASDSLIGMQATTLESNNDIDAVFASGNTMDERLMQRVFVRIMDRASKPETPSLEPVSRVCGWLDQLRSINGNEVFDKAVHGYLRAVVKGARDEALPVGPVDRLVASGCVDPATVVDMFKAGATPDIAASVLGIVLSSDAANLGLSECERYRLRLQKERFKQEHGSSLSSLFRLAADSTKLDVQDPNLVSFLISRSSAKPGSIRSFFDDDNLSDVAKANAGRAVTTILQLNTLDAQPSGKMDIRSLMSIAGPLSIHYCVEALSWMRSSTTWTFNDDDTLQAALMELFANQSEVLPQLLAVTSDKVNLAMHEWAQGQVLSMADEDSIETGERLQRCLDLLAVTNRAASKIDGAVFVDTIAAKLRDLATQVSDMKTFSPDSVETRQQCKYRLQLLLHLCVMHVHGIPDEVDTSKQARLNLLAVVCGLLVHPALQTQQDLVEYLFDLASALADNLFDEPTSAQKLPGMAKLPHDPRLTFILGTSASSTQSWLALASPVAPQGPPGPQGLQPPRVMGRQPSVHLQPPTSTSGQHVQQGVAQQQRFPPQAAGRVPIEVKLTPFALRQWEIMPDPTPVLGENDGSLSLGLFGARRV